MADDNLFDVISKSDKESQFLLIRQLLALIALTCNWARIIALSCKHF